MLIPRAFLPVSAVLAICSLAHLGAEENFPLRDAVEVSPRGGFPNFLAKAKTADADPIRVAYLGGSITAAPGWRVKSLEWLRERYPARSFEEIHAAIGGTGSDLGVFRLEQDVLRHDPDLLFVEFAVNDGGAAPDRIHQAMEGIVRQAWQTDPALDIVFVYTLSQPFLEDLQNGKFSRSASAMEQIADHYAIPTIHLGMEVAAREKAGTLIFKGEKPDSKTERDPRGPMVFSTDGVHPLIETGHELYRDAIARSWDAIEKASSDSAGHQLVAPYVENHWAAAKLVPIDSSMLQGNWEQLDSGEQGNEMAKRFAQRLPDLWLAKSAGATLEFSFRGTHCAFYDIVGPDGGRLEYVLDESEPKEINRIDGYCTYSRLSKFVVGNNLDPEVVHHVRIRLMEEPPDKREILFERNRSDFDRNPEKFEKNQWHVGSIMLIGEPAS